MIEYLGYSPETRARIVRVPQRVSDAMGGIALNLDNTEEGAEIDWRPFEYLMVALGSMSKAELYQSIKKIEGMSSIFGSEETTPNLKSSIGKLGMVFNK